MNVIVPLNLAALRVNQVDNSDVAPGFRGRTAVFEQIPNTAEDTAASTGDSIVRTIEGSDSPFDILGIGVHLHWELPDFFRRGSQLSDGGPVVFPQVPNRWLVIRYFSVCTDGVWSAPVPSVFLVESDCVGLTPYQTPSVSVPLTDGTQPYLYMGRTTPYGTPPPSTPLQYLPAYNDDEGNPCRLTSVGLVGPGFSSFYPECSSVFGFFDSFSDTPMGSIIANGGATTFKASYQVIGWIDPTGVDPLAGLPAGVEAAYGAYLQQCQAQGVQPAKAPSDMLGSMVEQQFGWLLQGLDPAQTLTELAIPSGTLVAGIFQELLWDTGTEQSDGSFLANTAGSNPSVWQGTGKVAVGNTTTEALSALLSNDLGNSSTVPAEFESYEYLLNALQLGLIQKIENGHANPVQLDEDLHAKAFASEFGGWIWMLDQPASTRGQPPQPDKSASLPAALAGLLATLNDAQKAYDQARFATELQRRQLFMDWYRYVTLQMATTATTTPFTLEQITNFVDLSGTSLSNSGELQTVLAAGTAAGVLQYQQDAAGNVIAPVLPAGGTGLAATLNSAFLAVQSAVQGLGWNLHAVPAPSFYLPTDPVLLAEGKDLQPARRNGPSTTIAVRTSGQIITSLTAGTTALTDLSACGLPAILSTTPGYADVVALVSEAALLFPMLAPSVQKAMAALGGSGNPAVSSPSEFIAALQAAQGGLDQLLHTLPFTPVPNPSQSTTAPIAVTFTWTNAAGTAYPPDAVGWMAQMAVPALSAGRMDPFLPLYMVWSAQLSPLQMQSTDANGWPQYSPGNLTQYFTLDSDQIDYGYATSNNFTQPAGQLFTYTGATILSTRAAYSLDSQIQAYLTAFPNDTAADPSLEDADTAYLGRNFVSQAMSGLNSRQILQELIPQIPVENLVANPLGYPVDDYDDLITSDVGAAAAGGNPGDNWYDHAFNSVMPIPDSYNFGPLRAGFLQVASLQIVDVFGQIMQFSAGIGAASLQTVNSGSLQPNQDDTAHTGQVYLAPRLLMPTRLWFRWLSAQNLNTGGQPPTEMSSHPATSPICGWVLPNHLENSLFFYDGSGASIGSIGIENGSLVYRTSPANPEPSDTPITHDVANLNPYLAEFMTHLYGQSAGFFQDLLTSIAGSSTFIQPGNSAQNTSLAVFVGRPLAIVRCTLGLETSGNLLPLSQESDAATAPFAQDVIASASDLSRSHYLVRQQYSTAALGGVQFPARLGNLADVNDGLVGYFVEGTPGGDYGDFYSQAAPENASNGVEVPSVAAPPFLLTLNATPLTFTMLVDPRAKVHATTGVLPMAGLAIPAEYYTSALAKLAATFFTSPILCPATGLTVPLPQEVGYSWNWIAPAASATSMPPNQVPLTANAVSGNAFFGYSPQTAVEGWLDLSPLPVTGDSQL